MSRDFSHVRFISAGAGSGKTYRLTVELERALVDGGVRPGRVIGTTFTVKAAAELRERVRERLIRSGRPLLAEQTAQALLGTVHSVCERLLRRFAFDLGLSPELAVASLDDCEAFFRQAVDEAVEPAEAREMNGVAQRLGLDERRDGGDWRADVKRLADRARDNDVAPDALAAMGRASAAEILAFLPPADADAGSAAEELRAAAARALERIDLAADTTKGTAKYVADLQAKAFELERPSSPWSAWMSLATASATKRSDNHAAAVRAAGAAFERHPHFHGDVRTYIEGVFAIAGRTLSRFQAIKAERGLIDFQDMEREMLRALDEPAVCGRLRAELELLLVDEFQDTSPMQLAIFMKLAELARHVVLVGDVKQAIFGFRGCDPELVFATLRALERDGSALDVLGSSWRSRPALVRYVNAVFGQAFAGRLPREQIVLAAERVERTEEPAVLWWQIEGRGAERVQAIASGVVRLVRSDFQVVDPDSGEPRAARWGDVAVLAATNDQVEEIAHALRAAQVPMKMTLSGLLTVPETCLAKACLRRLADRADTLATAEIVAMSDCAAPETWLADRLRWLTAPERESRDWLASSHPVVGKLETLREEIGTQSPVEIVARVLNYVGLREIVTAWGPNAIKALQRQRNLDAFLNLAVEYERHCEAQHSAATLTGFLFWLEHPHSAELDVQPVVTTGDAVHVLTYHKAKGLEWPVVVTTHLDFTWRSRIWDVRVDGPPTFDARRPLEGRTIRFWPNVFGDRRLPVTERIVASAPGTACAEQSEAENRRVAYVGLTRARDAVVLAVPAASVAKDAAWLQSFKGDHLLPTGEALPLPDGEPIRAAVVPLQAGADAADTMPFAPRRLPARAPLTFAVRETVIPSSVLAVPNASIRTPVALGERIPIHGEDMTTIGTALHALIAAELGNPRRADRVERARALLQGYGAEAFLDAEHALAAADRLREWLEQRFVPRRIWTEHPIIHALADGRVVRGWIDVLIETDAGFVVIDHKSSPRPRAEWPDEALEYSGQLATYRDALLATGRQVAGTWIHFAVGGGVVEVAVART